MPYIALLHSHETLVLLYLLIFLIKLILLLTNQQQSLAAFRRKTKVIGEMVLPSLFLISGIWLAVLSPQFIQQHWFIHKLVLLVVAIITGIFTFKKNSKLLGILTLLIFAYIFLTSYSKSENPFTKPYSEVSIKPDVSTDPAAKDYNLLRHGKYVYLSHHCTDCHGTNGDLGNSGAVKLSQSSLDSASVATTIRNGRKIMPAFDSKRLNEQELKAVTAYVMGLRRK